MCSVDGQMLEKITELGLILAILVQIHPHLQFKRALLIEGRVFDLYIDNNPGGGCPYAKEKPLERR